MASTSETGHAKNVANFLELYSFCKGYGPPYNPSKKNIQLSSLEEKYNECKTALSELVNYNTAYNNAINERVNLFKNNRYLSTRIVNAFETTDASPEAKKDIKGFNRKMQGKRAGKPNSDPAPADPNTPAPKNISASQRSYDMQIEHLSAMLSGLEAEPSYQPNEVDLQVVSLKAFIGLLLKANKEVAEATANISNARLKRDKVLYGEKNGMLPLVHDIKNYIKSVFGATSPEYRQISNIVFKIVPTK